MEEIILIAVSISVLVLGVMEAVKTAFNVNKRYVPLLAIIVGAAIGAAAIFLDVDLSTRAWAGGIAGLMSVGLFETGKNIKEEIE